jgi:hypothetical protein
MKRWQWALLLFELFLFALILVLPQVDLPDFTFHGGTAPVVAKMRVSPASPRALVRPVGMPTPAQVPGETIDATVVMAPPSLHSRLSLLCVLIC